MFFSVVIPLYNKANYITRCINSVLSQHNQEFELIIVDDGSTDGGVDRVREFKDPRIVLLLQENRGVSAARNTGVYASTSDFVTFLDADDIWDQNYLSVLKSLIDEYPDAGIYGLNHYRSFEDGRVDFEKYDRLFDGKDYGLITDYFALFSSLQKSPFSNSNCCFPKKVFLQVGGYKEGVRLTEDSDLWCRIALNHEVAFSIRPLATYFVETPNNTRFLMEDDDFQVTKTLSLSLKNKIVKPEFTKSVKKLIAFQQLSLVRRGIIQGYKRIAFKRIFKRQLIRHYPFKFWFYLFLIFLPTSKVVNLNRYLAKRK